MTRPVVPPAAIAVLCELLGRCPECAAAVVPMPGGFLSLTHRLGCELADSSLRSAS